MQVKDRQTFIADPDAQRTVVTLKKQTPSHTPKLGDWLWWPEYLMTVVPKEDLLASDIQYLSLLADNDPWRMLGKTAVFDDVQLCALSEATMYDCPFTNNKYLGVVPIGIISDDINKYRDSAAFPSDHGLWDMLWNHEWTRFMLMHGGALELHLDSVARASMGHGYTSNTRSGDGHGRIKDMKVELSNGDLLICKAWEWYNK